MTLDRRVLHVSTYAQQIDLLPTVGLDNSFGGALHGHRGRGIIKHDEFIKATFSSGQLFETNNIFALRGENLFLFHCVREDKKLNRVKLPCTSGSNPFLKNIFLE